MDRTDLNKILICWLGASAILITRLPARPLRVPPRRTVQISQSGKALEPVSRQEQPQFTAPAQEKLLRTRFSNAYGKLPLAFEQNRGQVNSRVRFLSRAPGYNLFLTGDEAVLVLRKGKSKIKSQKSKAEDRKIRETHSSIGNQQPAIGNTGGVLRLRLAGANAHAAVTGLDELPSKSNYILGNDPNKWRTNVAHYAKVKYKNVYSGVDLVYYGNQGQLEYDFVVAPGADPSVIRLELGADPAPYHEGRPPPDPLRLDAQGGLILKTGGGEVRLRKPLVYQEQATVDSSQLTARNEARNSQFKTSPSPPATRHFLNGRYLLRAFNRKSQTANRKYEITFQIAQYDHAQPLVIDPVLTYSTYLGGANLDYAYGIAVDSTGNAYLTGMTDSLDFPTAGSVQGPGGGTCTDDLKYPYNCFDAFVTKLNSTGAALLYSTFLGGSNDDRGAAIALDSSGNAYVTGYTVSTDFPTVNAFQSAYGGGNCGSPSSPTPCYSAFVAKLNPAGSALVYSTYLGGAGNDIASGISVDSLGAAYVVGSTSSTNFPITRSSLQGAYGGGVYNAFVTKLNPAGNTAAYSTYLGGSGEDHGAAIAVDSTGDAFVTGFTVSTNFPTQVPLQKSWSGGTCGTTPCFDAFVSELNPSGSALVYSTYMGGTGGDYGYGIALDSADNAYVTGLTTSTNFPVTAGAFQTTGGGTNYDAFISKLNSAGSALLYSTYFGGLGTEVAYGIALDASANAYITGYAYEQGMPLVSPLQSVCGFEDDAFVAKINSTGSALIFSSYLGGNGNDAAQGIAVDSSGSAYIAGGTFSTDFPVTPGALMTTYGGGAYNAFVAKISGLKLPVTTLSPTNVLFANQGVNTTSPPTTVILTNNGDAALNVSSIVANNDFAVTNNCGAVVAPGGSCNLSITFTPTNYGPRTGAVTVADNAWASPHLINLTGGGITSVTVSLLPSTLTFGNELAGTASASLPVTLTNLASVTLKIYAISAGPGFNQTNNCPAAMPGATNCILQVTFSPTSAGAFAAQITISDDASAGNPNQVVLSGTGTGPAASLSSASLIFGDQLLSTTSAQQTLAIANSGTTTLIVSGIATSGYFAQTNNCIGSLAVGASCSVNVTFTPINGGTSTGSIVISDNAFGSPQSVELSGNGTIPPHETFGVPLSPGDVHGKHNGRMRKGLTLPPASKP
ncbi:MAG TPA: SBBP repeat-containing protein [Terriglobia bacterium]|nr:SBBP repeat-containing protein [Terriglobia bacterium]